ncbi:MAG: hypothetical protein HKO64_05345 [Xanthomonadales bacterium]|nr:hypothetical protein [Xanthomonadales bacterium]
MRIAQWIGLFCAIISTGVLAMFTTYLVVAGQAQNLTAFILGLMALLSTLAGWAAIRRRALLLLALFIICYLPVGFYLTGVPSWARYAGYAQLGFLVSSLMMFWAGGTGKKQKKPG